MSKKQRQEIEKKQLKKKQSSTNTNQETVRKTVAKQKSRDRVTSVDSTRNIQFQAPKRGNTNYNLTNLVSNREDLTRNKKDKDDDGKETSRDLPPNGKKSKKGKGSNKVTTINKEDIINDYPHSDSGRKNAKITKLKKWSEFFDFDEF